MIFLKCLIGELCLIGGCLGAGFHCIYFVLKPLFPGGNELFKILLVNTGVDRRAAIFRSRQDLVDWQTAVIAEQVP